MGKIIYEFDDTNHVLNAYILKPNFEAIEEAKENYLKSKKDNELMYKIYTYGNPSWINLSVDIPLSRIDHVTFKSSSTILPIKKINNNQRGLLAAYKKSELDSSSLFRVFDDRTKVIKYYLILLSKYYTEKQKTSCHSNVLSVTPELFNIELLLQELFTLVSPKDLKGMEKYFELIQTGEISYSRLPYLIDNIACESMMEKAKKTAKLVHTLK